MSSKAGSTFVTFLMSIPVAAAGLMAIFGVPPLSSVIAASRNLNEKFQELGSEDRSARSESDSAFEEWDSSTAPQWGEDETSSENDGEDSSDVNPGRSGRKSRKDALGFSKPDDDLESEDNLSGKNGLADTARGQSHREREKGSKDHSDEGDPFAFRTEGSKDSSERPSLKESLKKLHQISGMKHYHLEPGQQDDTWLFVCLFSAAGDSNVVYRFEAEASDPETAVTRTLEQIESWQLDRFRDQQAISQFSSPAGRHRPNDSDDTHRLNDDSL